MNRCLYQISYEMMNDVLTSQDQQLGRHNQAVDQETEFQI